MLEKESEVSKELKFFNKRGRKKCSKKQQNNWPGVQRLSGKRKEKRRVRETTVGTEGKATAETRGRRGVATNGADSGEPAATGGWGRKAAPPGGGEDAAPATVLLHGERRAGGGGRRRGVHRSERGVPGKGSERAGERPGGAGQRGRLRSAPGPSPGRERARPPKGRRRRWGRGGAAGGGEAAGLSQ